LLRSTTWLWLCLAAAQGGRVDSSCPCAANFAPEAKAICRPAWSETLTPAGANSFYGVTALSRTDVWAVGSHYDGIDDRPFAEHFDGRQWVIATVPAPGPGGAYLRGVAGSSGSDVWAAGYQTTSSGVQKTLFEHFDGTAWAIVSSPNPQGFASYVASLVALAPNDIWAAGYYLGNTGVYRTLAEHWDGVAWTIVATPNAGDGDSVLNGIAGGQPNDVWAVGYGSTTVGGASTTLALHFDGTSWSVVPSPNPGGLTSSLNAVAALADGTIWAAGFYYDGTRGRTLLLHGEGSSFTVLPGDDYPAEGNVLNGIAASGLGDIWAVGYHYPNGTADYQGLIEHYDGEQWQTVSSAQGGSYTYLAGIAAQPAGAAWSVGNTLTTTIAESICEIQVGNAGFVPKTTTVGQGQTAGWSFVGSDAHQLVDSSGLGLFDSGSRASGSSFQFAFNSAGGYRVSDSVTGAIASVGVPVQLPAKGKPNKSLLVTWGAAPPMAGLVIDVQIQLPGQAFEDWMVGQTKTAANYVPPATGDYAFRARLRNAASGVSSNWSPPVVVVVSAL